MTTHTHIQPIVYKQTCNQLYSFTSELRQSGALAEYFEIFEMAAFKHRLLIGESGFTAERSHYIICIDQCLSQELKKVRHMSHQAEKGETCLTTLRHVSRS